jgi:hypothetical protein
VRDLLAPLSVSVPVLAEHEIRFGPLPQAGIARVDDQVAKLPPRFRLTALPALSRLLRIMKFLEVRVEFVFRPYLGLGGAKLANLGSVKLRSVNELNSRHLLHMHTIYCVRRQEKINNL